LGCRRVIGGAGTVVRAVASPVVALVVAIAEGTHLGKESVVGLGCREAVVGLERTKAGE
jgi:hypothetical protein